jgi:hypothetical protein
MTANRIDPGFTGRASSPGRGVSSRTSVVVVRVASGATELSRHAPAAVARTAATPIVAARFRPRI